jgi:hypothetical protein
LAYSDPENLIYCPKYEQEAVMPFQSDKQRKWMYANKPEMAKKWSKEGAYAKAIRAGSQSPMGKKKTSATGAVGGAG